MTSRIEVYEDREVTCEEGGQSYNVKDEIKLGEFDLREVPRPGEWLSLRAFGAPNFYEGHCFNVYKVREVWHEGIHTSWTALADQCYEETRGPKIKIYVTFSHTLNPGVYSGFQCGRAAHPLQRA